MEFLDVAWATDFAIAGVLTAIFIFYSWWRGADLLVLISISLPIAGFLYKIFPYQDGLIAISPLGELTSPIFFLVILILSSLVVRRAIGTGFGGARPLHIIITSVVLTLLLISFSYHVVPIEGLHDFGSFFDSVFASSTNFFWIVAIALLALFVV